MQHAFIMRDDALHATLVSSTVTVRKFRYRTESVPLLERRLLFACCVRREACSCDANKLASLKRQKKGSFYTFYAIAMQRGS